MKALLKYPALVLIIILGITVYFGLQLPNLIINNDLEIFIPDDHPSKIARDSMEETFGSQSVVGVGVEFSAGTVFTPERVSLISELSSRIKELDYVDSVSSLTTADYIEGTTEGMRATSLIEDFSGSDREVRQLKTRILSWQEMYRKNLVSDDFSSSQIAVTLIEEARTEEREVFYHQLKETLDEYRKTDISFSIAGDPVATVLLKKNMTGDLTYLIPLVTLVVMLALFFAFRNFGGVLLPIITVLMSTIWATGIMSLLGIYFSMISTVIPVILIAVGSAYVIHIFNHYYDSVRNSSSQMSRETHTEIVHATVRDIGPPVVMTALTTAAGFASIATSSIAPMRHFGIINAIGVIAALVITLTFVPSVLLLRHRALKQSTSRKTGFDHDAGFNRILEGFYRYFSKQRARIIILSIVVIALSLFGISRIVVDNSMIEYFDYDSELRVSDRFLQNKFSGSKIFSIIVEGEEKGSLTDPEILQAMDGLKAYLYAEHEDVGSILAFSDFVKRMNKVMNYPSTEIIAESGGAPVFRSTMSGGSSSTAADTSPGAAGNGGSSGASVEGSFFSDSGSGADTSTSGGNSASPAARTGEFGYHKSVSYAKLAEALNRAYYDAESMNMSVHDLLRNVNRQLNFQGEYYNEIPTDPSKYPVSSKEELSNLVSQYLLVYSGSLDDFANDSLEPSKARMSVQLRSTNTKAMAELKQDINAYVKDYFPEGYRVSIAGYADMELAVTNLIVRSQILSLLSAFLVVFLIVAIANRSLIAGIYGIIPLSFAVLINFGIMGIAGIDLDIATAMIASIAIGIGVDYSIHFLSRYRLEWNATRDPDEATRRTVMTTGRAIAFNALAVAAGFAVLLFSNFNPLRYVGLLVAIIMGTSSIAAMTILPVLLNIFQPRFLTNKSDKEKGEHRL